MWEEDLNHTENCSYVWADYCNWWHWLEIPGFIYWLRRGEWFCFLPWATKNQVFLFLLIVSNSLPCLFYPHKNPEKEVRVWVYDWPMVTQWASWLGICTLVSTVVASFQHPNTRLKVQCTHVLTNLLHSNHPLERAPARSENVLWHLFCLCNVIYGEMINYLHYQERFIKTRILLTGLSELGNIQFCCLTGIKSNKRQISWG